MSGVYISKALRCWLLSLGERCEYCQTSELVTGIVLDADHIQLQPQSKGGETIRLNLCRACSSCNTNKNNQTEAFDPVTEQIVPLFHPREQQWAEHFVWNDDGTTILGLTPTGRATITTLKLNNPHIIRSRELWVSVGWHPPSAT